MKALRADWADAALKVDHALIWATDHWTAEITHLTRDAIMAKVHQGLHGDASIDGNACFIDGASMDASAEALVAGLENANPGLVVTTSHGQTGPLHDPLATRRDLGLQVDQSFRALDPARLVARWAPDGEIWYADACCSAGSDRSSTLQDLFDAGSSVERIFNGVAALGAMNASVLRLLLGNPKPLRAFIGQVEPIFDWTLKQPDNPQHLTDPLRKAHYTRLYHPCLVGHQFRDWYAGIVTIYGTLERTVQPRCRQCRALRHGTRRGYRYQEMCNFGAAHHVA